MESIYYQPQNKKYFSKLLSFAKELFEICKELNIKPIVYGSLPYASYTRDETISINDIDLLVPESSFSKIIDKIKENKELRYEETDYHSLKIFKDDVKITFDAIEEYYKDLPYDFVEVKINDVLFTIIPLRALKEIYKRGKETIPIKREQYSKKLEKLNSVAG